MARRISRRRRGVSLLEVLFSIGIIAVGLLGVMILVPAAAMRAKQGAIIDDSDRVGRNAIRMFDTANMRQPNMWTWCVPGSGPPTPIYQEYGVALADLNRKTYFWRPNTTSSWQARSFCIDPLFIATHYYDAKANSTPMPNETAYFPYAGVVDNVAATRMDRVSLRNFPGGPSGVTVDQAYHVFLAEDDLVFDLPADRTLVPEQKYDSSISKRQYEGKYSWLATMTPRYTSYDGTSYMDIVPDTYIMSIVVFHRRDLSMELGKDPSTTDWEKDGPDNERLVSVAAFPGQGYSGGEVQLQLRAGRPVQDLEVKEGQWLMLSATVQSPPSSGNWVPLFRWYRVIGVDDVDPTATPWTRNVTLLGPDWNYTSVATQATLLNNIVTVYEKTVRLETSSMWTGL